MFRSAGPLRSYHEIKTSATGSELNINMNQILYNQHLRPIVVHDRTGSARRNPNKEELERIINHLHRLNQQQEREVGII